MPSQSDIDDSLVAVSGRYSSGLAEKPSVFHNGEEDIDSDTQPFSYPTNPHEAGTYKHKMVADKLRKELSLLLSIERRIIYEFRNPIRFELPLGKHQGIFNQKEINSLNHIMDKLHGSDIVLVEHSVSVAGDIAGKNTKMDLVAYRKSTGLLQIIDWKFGTNPVGIDNNEQLKSYMRCLLKKVFPKDNIKWVELLIVQPNGAGGAIKTKMIDMME